jgi:hypothetical protein
MRGQITFFRQCFRLAVDAVPRTSPRTKFPCSWPENRDFSPNRSPFVRLGRSSGRDFNRLQGKFQIPYSIEQGIFSAEQGTPSGDQGIFALSV